MSEKYCWDLSKFCKNESEFNKGLKELKKISAKLEKFKGRLGNKENLREFLNIQNEFDIVAENLAIYISSLHNTNLADGKYIEQENILSSIFTEAGEKTAFATPELLLQPQGYIEGLIKDPAFKNNVFSFKCMLRNREHILSEKEEKLLASAANFTGEFGEVYHALIDVDLKFDDCIDKNKKKHKLNNSNFSVFLESADRTLRKSAFENLYAGYEKFGSTISANFIANLKKDFFTARVRGFESVLERKMFPDNISKKVYETLTGEVSKNLPLLHEYYKIKKQKTKLSDFNYYDMAVSIAEGEEKKFTFEQTHELAKNALSILGSEYVSLVDRSFKERWIDVFPKPNKRGGAYQTGCYNRTPLVLLNFEGRLDDAFTLVHELGHANHTYFSNLANPRETADYTIFLAEVASTVNEVLLLKHLYKNAKTNSEKIYLLDKYLRMFKSTLFRQTMFSMFETYAHSLVQKNEGISREKLNEFYGSLNKKFHGEAVQFNDFIKIEWMRIPHFYSSFYVYKYSTGFVTAINLANQILSGNKQNFYTFLKSGGSDFSTEILKRAGVDLNTKKPYDVAFNEMKWALNELKTL